MLSDLLSLTPNVVVPMKTVHDHLEKDEIVLVNYNYNQAGVSAKP